MGLIIVNAYLFEDHVLAGTHVLMSLELEQPSRHRESTDVLLSKSTGAHSFKKFPISCLLCGT